MLEPDDEIQKLTTLKVKKKYSKSWDCNGFLQRWGMQTLINKSHFWSWKGVLIADMELLLYLDRSPIVYRSIN